MGKAWQCWTSMSLILRILAGLIVGAVLGVLVGPGLTIIDLFGTLFIAALKGVAPILVFFRSSAPWQTPRPPAP